MVKPPRLNRPVPLVLAQRAAEGKPSKAASKGKAAGLGQSCRSDAECVVPGTICERRRCVKVTRAINILWLFYRSADRRYTSVLGLYHHRRGKEGFHVLGPFYWHFWSKRSRTRIVAPVFWQFENKQAKSKHPFVLNFHHFRKPGVRGFNVWPFLFTRSYGKKGFSFSFLPLVHYGRKGKAWSMYLLGSCVWTATRGPAIACRASGLASRFF